MKVLSLFFSVAAESEINKMTLNNLATIFGPNLLRPGGNQPTGPFDVMSPVNVLMFFLVCPLEVFDDPSSTGSAPSSASKGSKKRHEIPYPLTDESTTIVSSQSTGFVTTPASSPSDTMHSSNSVLSTTDVTTPTVVSTAPSLSSTPTTVSTPTVSTPSTSSNPSTPTVSNPVRYKQSLV